jgi:hypothetical protein
MLYKHIESYGQRHDGAEFNQDLAPMPGDSSEFLAKTASAIPMTQEMQDFWNHYPKKMPDKFLYVRINILGSGEYWGSNLNGDFFPESVLKEYHKTFHHARVYLHHQNKDPRKCHGRVIFSTYNDAPYAKRVEVIVALDRSDPRIRETIEKIEAGKRIEVSMGCRVPFDICSVCGNRASTRKQYCVHLKNQMNKLMPDGNRVMAINTHPAFFDVSVVTIPADPSSGGMEKIARKYRNFSSAYLGEMFGLEAKFAEVCKEKEDEKDATIEKTGPDDKEKEDEVPEEVKGKEEDLRDLGSQIGRNDKDMPEHMLEQLSDFPLSETLATLGGMKIPLRPHEYTCIVIKKMASSEAGTRAYREGAQFASTAPQEAPTFDIMTHFNPKIARLLRPMMTKRSMYPRYVMEREDALGLCKKAGKVEISHPKAAALYAAYIRDVTNLNQTKVAALLSRYPEIRDRVTGALEDRLFHKTASRHNVVTDSYIGQELLKGAYGG